MENNHKIIIAALIGIIIILGGAIMGTLLKEPSKTVELFENGTTIDVPASTNLKAHDEFSTTYVTGKNTTIIGVDNNNLIGALASKIISSTIVDKGEKQDNGLYKLDKKSIMEIGDKLGFGYDEDNIKEVHVGIKHNNTVNQSVIVVGIDENEMINILSSINWKKGASSNATGDIGVSTNSNADKTYPFYADDGSIMGYYHVGEVVEYLDGLYQLQENGNWKYIGEAKGSSENAYNQGYSDALDEDSSYDSSSSSDSESSSSSESTEPTTDG